MNKTEIIEQIEKLYNAAADLGDVYLESALHDILIDTDPIRPHHVCPKCKQIDNYKILNQWLIVGYNQRIVCLYLAINDGQRAYLTCEASGGACVLWYEDPSDSYEDRLSYIWNLTDIWNEQGHCGYVTEPAGAFDQWIFPVDNITDDEGMGRTDAENELYQFAATLADMLC